MTPKRFTTRQKADIKPQTQAPKGVEQYIADLESLLKKNTGSGLSIGQDTSSNIPMYLPGKVRNPGGIGESAASIQTYGNGMTQPNKVQRTQTIELRPNQIDAPPAPMTAEEFLQQFGDAFTNPGNNPPGGVPEGIDYSQAVASSADGGVIYRDGSIHYEDGTTRTGDPNATPIASHQSGGVQYSDGSIRQKAPYAWASFNSDPNGREVVGYSDNTKRYGNYLYQDGQASQQPTPGGLEGLVSGIFGKMRPITQAYGNYNPQLEPGSGYNTGTDIRTRDLQGSERAYKLPVDAQVIQVLQDDGTQWGDISGHQGWGNSVLVRLASGEMLRFSHMGSLANLQEGDVIKAGEVFGTPGQTGNTTGEHLDLMYYTPEGQVANPSQFSGFTNPQGLRTPVPGQEEPGTIIPNQSTQQNQSPSQPTQSIQQPMKPIETPVLNAVKTVAQAPKNVFNTAENTANAVTSTASLPFLSGEEQKQAKKQSDEALTKLGFNKEGTVGGQEILMGDIPGAVNEISKTSERVGNSVGGPELFLGEFLRGEKPLGQVLSSTRQYLGLPATGLRSAIEQKSIVPKAMASEDIPNKINEPNTENSRTLQSDINTALSKAGQGISNLAQSGISSLENVFKTPQVAPKRAVGDVSGTVDTQGNPSYSSLMDTAQSRAGMPKNDTRDSFFKMGGMDMYKDFIKPNADQIAGGALTLDLFNDNFFGDLGNISSVFGGSKDLGAATQKYVDKERQKYPMMQKMNYEEGYDRGEIDNYNKSVDEYNNSLNTYFSQLQGSTAGIPSIFTPRIAGSSKNVFATSAPNYTPAAPSASKPVMASFNAPKVSAAPVKNTPAMASFQPQRTSTPSNANTSTNNGPVYSAPPKASVPAKSPVASYNPPKQTFTPAKANTSTNNGPVYSPAPKKATPAPQSKQSSNIFTSVKKFISNIFR